MNLGGNTKVGREEPLGVVKNGPEGRTPHRSQLCEGLRANACLPRLGGMGKAPRKEGNELGGPEEGPRVQRETKR